MDGEGHLHIIKFWERLMQWKVEHKKEHFVGLFAHAFSKILLKTSFGQSNGGKALFT